MAWYGHLKIGVTSASVGDSVQIGDFLGYIGSSGSSTEPHLHLGLYDSNDNLIDPFVGSCNNSTSVSWWANQVNPFSKFSKCNLSSSNFKSARFLKMFPHCCIFILQMVLHHLLVPMMLWHPISFSKTQQFIWCHSITLS